MNELTRQSYPASNRRTDWPEFPNGTKALWLKGLHKGEPTSPFALWGFKGREEFSPDHGGFGGSVEAPPNGD